MRFFNFHLMPYPSLPSDYDGPVSITCPNELFDPAIGQQIYNRYLDELIYSEELGFDGVCVNEHHQNAYGTMPSPNLMAANLARQTKRVKIAIVGNALPLYDPHDGQRKMTSPYTSLWKQSYWWSIGGRLSKLESCVERYEW